MVGVGVQRGTLSCLFPVFILELFRFAALPLFFALQFPEGYQTQVGERGLSLSGGQKRMQSLERERVEEKEEEGGRWEEEGKEEEEQGCKRLYMCVCVFSNTCVWVIAMCTCKKYMSF
jgi:hypothetical protein